MNSKHSILIVDDRIENLFTLEKTLGGTGSEIVKAQNGNEALATTLNYNFALAVLDVQMPGMDGFELAEILRNDEKTSTIPIIFLTAYSMGETAIFKGYKSGAVDYIVKPYRPEILLSKANVFLELHRQKELLADANRELEAFAYSVSHDLRAPLRAIDGFSKILLEDYSDSLDAEGNRLLNVVCENTDKMAQLIDDILSFSRMRRNEMSGMEIDISPLVNEIVMELEQTTGGRNIEWRIDDLETVFGDAAMIKVALKNLIGNAVKYTKKKDPAIIEIGISNDGGATRPNFVTFFIQDNGAGFNMKFADKLFGVFQRLHGPDEFEGTGAGLAIVQRVIERHGGSVRGVGEIEKGSTFYFSLPTKSTNGGAEDG